MYGIQFITNFYFVITLYKANYNTNTFDREALASASLNTRCNGYGECSSVKWWNNTKTWLSPVKKEMDKWRVGCRIQRFHRFHRKIGFTEKEWWNCQNVKQECQGHQMEALLKGVVARQKNDFVEPEYTRVTVIACWKKRGVFSCLLLLSHWRSSNGLCKMRRCLKSGCRVIVRIEAKSEQKSHTSESWRGWWPYV